MFRANLNPGNQTVRGVTTERREFPLSAFLRFLCCLRGRATGSPLADVLGSRETAGTFKLNVGPLDILTSRRYIINNDGMLKFFGEHLALSQQGIVMNQEKAVFDEAFTTLMAEQDVQLRAFVRALGHTSCSFFKLQNKS